MPLSPLSDDSDPHSPMDADVPAAGQQAPPSQQQQRQQWHEEEEEVLRAGEDLERMHFGTAAGVGGR